MQRAAHTAPRAWSQIVGPATTRQCLKCRASLRPSTRAYGVLPPPRDGEEKDMLDRILRVDHAGEYGANRIYAGQMAVLGRSRVGPLIQEMWDQEKKHLEKFNEILAENRVRPTALLPLWNIAGFALGASSALLGKEGAMACTVAVEESISEHYNSQIRALMEKDPERYIELLNVIKEFRDDEMEHHDTGLAHDAETLPGYWLLKNAIQLGCRAAIYVSQRV
ncbi:putative ubiquinone biosynthesis protein COQ7 -like isoform 2 [Scophthalmus maximus]|uniref:5-demethoxyubiquinone hydroxylase, mitochondrial n=1 Tax=Scophthalmus maximus TaxID=52904 RepID=A0A2U9BPU5_SCOMX|nr:5-demethoxyubiquinone hydroxylase, mitochondrial [Scophthalmus maximus]AWP06188.1 putative ubiquinone biosynthesis protein COQ7 -like isoform 2 [Scophthalmus maximus]